VPGREPEHEPTSVHLGELGLDHDLCPDLTAAAAAASASASNRGVPSTGTSPLPIATAVSVPATTIRTTDLNPGASAIPEA
jgi:hypothetical protein